MSVSLTEEYAKAELPHLVISLKLDVPGGVECSKAHAAFQALDPNDWDISFKFKYSERKSCTLILSSELGELILYDFPQGPSAIDLTEVYRRARYLAMFFSYNKFVEKLRLLA